MRVVFMGSPPFSVSILQALVETGFEVVGVATQPDRPKGRGRSLAPSAVAALADELGLPTVKPVGKKDPSLNQALRQWQPDVSVVAAFGLILTEETLNIPRYGSINVHASLLPKYRGASPIQAAIINGENQTGVTTMQMDAGLDTGDMLLNAEVPIEPDMTAGELEEKLSEVGARLTVETLRRMEKGTLERTPQDHSQATVTRLMKPEDGYILWNLPANETYNRIRGCTPRPGARAFLGGKPLRLQKAMLSDATNRQASGEAVVSGRGTLLVTSGDGRCVELLEVQPAGKASMQVQDFLRGLRLREADILKFDRQPPET